MLGMPVLSGHGGLSGGRHFFPLVKPTRFLLGYGYTERTREPDMTKTQVAKIKARDIQPGMLVRNQGRATNQVVEVLSCEPSEDSKGRWIVVFEYADGFVSQVSLAGHAAWELH